MKKILTFLVIVLQVAFMESQTVERINVKGEVLATTTDVEGITIFNTSSNKGTITNKKGEFEIEVALNDRIEVSALQFEPVVVTIDDNVISTRVLKIYLREHVNNLDAVLLTYGLSGNLPADVKSIKPMPSIDINFGNMDAYMLSIDNAVDNKVIQDALNAVVNKNQLYNGFNFKEFVKLFFNSKRKIDKDKMVRHELKPIQLLDVYSPKYLAETFNIPKDSLGTFINFLKSNGMSPDLLKPENEIQLIEFMTNQSKLFLKTNNGKI